eukprot:10833860-Karenia_brevis.AAC.1
MPAHTSVTAIGTVRDSVGRPIDAVDWRANRLADVLAKFAANAGRVPTHVIEFLDTAAEALEFYAAQLGA